MFDSRTSARCSRFQDLVACKLLAGGERTARLLVYNSHFLKLSCVVHFHCANRFERLGFILIGNLWLKKVALNDI